MNQWSAFAEEFTENLSEESAFHRLFTDAVSGLEIDGSDTNASALEVRNELQLRPWQKCTDFGGIDFDDRSKCCGYLYRYALCHCALTRKCIRDVFSRVPFVMMLLKAQKLKVVSAGGGPGNDLVGFCSALSTVPSNLKFLDLAVIDFKDGWKEVFERIAAIIPAGNYGHVSDLYHSLSVSSSFVHANLATDNLSAISTADIVMMTKVLSVVPYFQKQKILQNIFRKMKEGAIFIFIDIDSEKLVQMAAFRDIVILYQQKTEMKSFHTQFNPKGSISVCSYGLCVVQKRLPYFADNLYWTQPQFPTW